MKLRLDNLVYTVTDPAEIDRLYDLGAVPFEEEQEKEEPEESKQEEVEDKDEPENTEEKPKETRGRGKK